MRATSILLCLWVVGLRSGLAQGGVPDSTQADKYALVIYAGGGVSVYPKVAEVPVHLDTRARHTGASVCARLMWLPDRRLRVGLESGWTTLYTYDIEGPGPKGRVELVAVPLVLLWSMPVTERLSLFVGYGTYYLTSELDYLGSARASAFSMGYAAALSYVVPFGPRLGLAIEAKWYNAAETRHTLLCGQAQLVWKLHHW